MNFGSPPVDMWLSRLAAEYLRGGIPSFMQSKSLALLEATHGLKVLESLGGREGGEGGEGGRGGEKKERFKRYLSIITVPILYKSTSEIRRPL